jgi:hypothetical protein
LRRENKNKTESKEMLELEGRQAGERKNSRRRKKAYNERENIRFQMEDKIENKEWRG